ncbi:MAG: RpiB/LacA/LacB family sugar-phosphate isomerase [Acidimicrobiia bacterium]|nr:RpiB/LacA/LacB family sugar-phosphate isomerase [Acidimicrobiia bacterium]MYC57714.1 RpiB/LacA/LacB family sugar-phosphate isomerase [Acidimicrobiia bacterium]MYG93618.1 RpiB/LacA/LacB family sugar-phosphate isomerase [Acidimicrobiia bacterium]MYI30913.1 RpiB/LacA/LacB family sugar-phosphate isomerase [Acidimicrobiia bacterium]
MRIAFGTDQATALTAAIKQHLTNSGHHIVTTTTEGAAWPDVGQAVGKAVTDGSADLGVVCCWTGTGVSIAANKVAGVRAALCTDAKTAHGARRWNDANVLAMSLRLTSADVATEMLDAFLNSEPDPNEYPEIAKLS